MKAFRPHRISAAIAAGIAASASALAQTVVTTTWSSADADWSDPVQWAGTPAGYGVPNNSAVALFYVNIGGGTVSLYDYFTLSRLTMSGGTLAGDGILTVTGNASFANAILAGEVQTRLHGATTQSGALSLVDSHALVNTGAYNWGGALSLGTGTSFENSGTVTSAGSTARTATGADATAGFGNSGTFTKSGTGTTTFSGLRFVNTGLADVQRGTLSLEGGGQSTGNFTGAGTIAFRGGYTLASGTVSTTNVVFSGDTGLLNVLGTGATLASSSVTFSSGETRIDGLYNATASSLRGGLAAFNADSTTSTFTLNGGTLGGTGRLAVTGTARLTTGTMTGAGLTHLIKGSSSTQTGTLNLADGRLLQNDGTYTWTGALNLADGAIFYNSGTLLSPAGNRTASATGSGSVFANLGTFVKSGTGTTTFSTLPLLNGGTVDIQSGTLSLAGGGQSVGSFTGAGTVAFRGGYQLGGGVSTTNVIFSGDPANPNVQTGGLITSANVTFASGVTQLDGGYHAGATALLGGTARFLGANTTDTLTMNGGVLGGGGLLTVTGNASLRNATMTEGGQTSLLGITTQSGTLTIDSGRVLFNEGTFNWSAGLSLTNSSIIHNAGTFLSAGSGARTASATGGGSVFLNLGTFVKSGTGITTFSTLPFLNGGTVDIQGGTLSLAGGGQSIGSFTGAGTVAFRGDYLIGAGAISTANVVFSGTDATPNQVVDAAITSASVNFASGTTSIGSGYNAGATTIAGTANFLAPDSRTTTFNLNNTGILGGSGSLAVTGNATLAGGTIRDSGQLYLRGATTQSGALTLDTGRMLSNEGAYNWVGALTVNNSAAFINALGGTVTSAGNANRTAAGAGVGASFVNRGSFLKTGTGSTTFSTLPFYNQEGTVEIQGGTLALAAGGSSFMGDFTGAGTLAVRGNYQIGGGTISTANVVFSGTASTPNFIGATSFSSAKVNFASGVTGIYGGYAAGATTVSGTANFEASSTTRTLSLTTAGVLGGTGVLDVTGDATLAGGTLRDAGHLHLQGTTTQTGTLTLSGGHTLQNEGTFDQRGTIALASGELLINRGTFTTGGTGTRTLSSTSGSGYFINTGTFASSAATNVTGIAVDNTGRIDVRSGTLTFSGPVVQAMSGTIHRGDWSVGNGTSTATLAFTDPGVLPITTIAPEASVTLNGPRSTFAAINTVTDNQGTFRLLGGRNFTVQGGEAFTNSGTLELGGGARFTSAGGLVNSATGTLRGSGTFTGSVDSFGLIAPGASPGLLTFSNDLFLNSTSVTLMELGGVTQGSEYDALNVNGLLTFDGLLEVASYDSYIPGLGTSFDLFNWGSTAGVFDTVNLPALTNGLGWDTTQLYSSGVITVIPEPSTVATILGVLALGLAVIWRRRAR